MTKDEWIQQAKVLLSLGASLLRLEADEWRRASSKIKEPKTEESMKACAEADEGMAGIMLKHCSDSPLILEENK